MRFFQAYRVTNRLSGKVYIGITTRPIERRWGAHVAYALKGETQGRLGPAIRKYGPEAFDVEHIASCRSWDDLCATESALIEQHDSYRRGYNCTLGGDGARGFRQTQEHVDRREKSRRETLEKMGGSPLRGRPKTARHRASMAVSRQKVMASDPTLAQRMVAAAALSRSVVRKHSNSRGLLDEQVTYARQQRAEGVRLRDLATFYAVSDMAIERAVRGRTYRHVPMLAWSMPCP